MGKAMKAKAMKAVKGGAKPLSKGGLAQALSGASEIKPKECKKIIEGLAEIGTTEVKKTGKFIIPGLCMIKTRVKPAAKAGKREIFGKMTLVKAKPARTAVKAFPVSVLKKTILIARRLPPF